jgi:L-lactate utilization protein LutB
MNSTMQNNLIEELELDKFPTDKQEEIIIKMTELVLKRMFLETMDKLSANDQELLGTMMEAQDEPEKIENFLQEKIENYDEMLQGIINKLKEEMINA